MTTPRQIILIPGLLEPRFAMWPLRRCLRRQCDQVYCWRDRVVFRDLQASVDRLATEISGDADQLGSVAIVTHSFGDWIARAAIAQSSNHRVNSLVSIAPAMRAGFLPMVAYGFTGNLIPEIKVIMDRASASANLNCDDRVRRLVIWSRFDESLRQVALDGIDNLEVQRVWGTHLSVALQPNTMRITSRFLARQ